MVRIPVREHWNRLPKEGVEFSSLQKFQMHLAVLLSPPAGDPALAEALDNMISRGPFQT